MGATENLQILGDCLERSVEELVVVVMDRPRHKELIQEIRAAGARVRLISDGDVSAAISCGFAGTNIHGLMGESRDGNLARLKEMGIEDADRVYSDSELASGETVLFAACGITPGTLMEGVRFFHGGARTQSLVISSQSQTARFVDTIHIQEQPM